MQIKDDTSRSMHNIGTASSLSPLTEITSKHNMTRDQHQKSSRLQNHSTCEVTKYHR